MLAYVSAKKKIVEFIKEGGFKPGDRLPTEAELCQQLDVEENDVTMESSLTDDLGADSLDLVDTVMSLEDEFDIEVPDSAIEEIKTVGDIAAYIEKNQ